ncbi:MAG TPA: shikimate dehydrogenase [Deltaproteobacteria bacterium]|nr:shikimate dehydrogenase [Deltaproteobacteria bacterium]
MPVKSKIQSLAVIGDPISHSLSPLMHNAAIRKLKAPYRYKAIRVTPKKLEEFSKTCALRLAGFNVTVPHKEAIVPFLDRLAYEAKLIGAVNTVVCKNGELIGFNTDGAGYLMSLQAEKKFNPGGRRIMILGAGGAARALAAALILAKAKSVIVANRTPKRAVQLVRELSFRLPGAKLEACPLTGKEFETALRRCDLLINTTRVGLGGSSFENFPWEKLKASALVSDIVYSPRFTPFLKSARKHKHPIHTGDGMLLYQGALAFEIWTGLKPDVKEMRKILHKKLK